MKPAEAFIGRPIRSLQTMLRVLAENDWRYVSLIPDGIYGPDTARAVTIFQRRNGIPPTGVTDQATWDAIVAAYGPALVERSAPQPMVLALEPGEVIHRGQRSAAVPVVQGVLLVLSQVWGIPAPGQGFALDEATAQAVAAFQTLAALPPTGELNRMTWKHLALHYPLAMGVGRKKGQ